MRIRTTAVTVTVLLALAGCSSSDDGKPEPAASPTSTPATASASPTVDQAAMQACITAWAQSIRQGASETDPAPAACDGIPDDDGLLYARALKQSIQENRQRMDDCLADPACTELPIVSSAP